MWYNHHTKHDEGGCLAAGGWLSPAEAGPVWFRLCGILIESGGGKTEGWKADMAGERLDKILSSQGLCSRREARNFLKKHRVELNGVRILSPEKKVEPQLDVLSVDGQALELEKYIYLMMNKPGGVVSASRDPRERTVVDLVPEEYFRRDLFPAGRLDKDTRGLLIITNDGGLAHQMLSPKKKVDKIYQAVLSAPVTPEDIEAFHRGIQLEDGTLCREAELRVVKDGENPLVEIRIHEGKFHQVKRMVQARGKEVLSLRRIQIGGLLLDPALEEGKCRKMSKDECKRIFIGKN